MGVNLIFLFKEISYLNSKPLGVKFIITLKKCSLKRLQVIPEGIMVAV